MHQDDRDRGRRGLPHRGGSRADGRSGRVGEDLLDHVAGMSGLRLRDRGSRRRPTGRASPSTAPMPDRAPIPRRPTAARGGRRREPSRRTSSMRSPGRTPDRRLPKFRSRSPRRAARRGAAGCRERCRRGTRRREAVISVSSAASHTARAATVSIRPSSCSSERTHLLLVDPGMRPAPEAVRARRRARRWRRPRQAR